MQRALVDYRKSLGAIELHRDKAGLALQRPDSSIGGLAHRFRQEGAADATSQPIGVGGKVAELACAGHILGAGIIERPATASDDLPVVGFRDEECAGFQQPGVCTGDRWQGPGKARRWSRQVRKARSMTLAGAR